jgi:hypothetical protein
MRMGVMWMGPVVRMAVMRMGATNRMGSALRMAIMRIRHSAGSDCRQVKQCAPPQRRRLLELLDDSRTLVAAALYWGWRTT